jgi:hypothetical protein
MIINIIAIMGFSIAMELVVNDAYKKALASGEEAIRFTFCALIYLLVSRSALIISLIGVCA